jgi:hypothetical protein
MMTEWMFGICSGSSVVCSSVRRPWVLMEQNTAHFGQLTSRREPLPTPCSSRLGEVCKSVNIPSGSELRAYPVVETPEIDSAIVGFDDGKGSRSLMAIKVSAELGRSLTSCGGEGGLGGLEGLVPAQAGSRETPAGAIDSRGFSGSNEKIFQGAYAPKLTADDQRPCSLKSE